MILIILLYAFFASSFLIGKILLTNYTTPIFLAGSRMFIAGLILLMYQYFYAHTSFRFQKKHIWYYAQIMFFGIYITYILRLWALDSMSAAKACFFSNVSPFLSSLYSYFFFNETMSRKQWAGLVIGFFGLIPILISSSPAEQCLKEFTFFSWHELALLASFATHSYSWIVVRKLVRDKSYSPAMVNGITMFAGGLLALISSFFVEGLFPVTNVPHFLGWLLLVILVSNIICHNLYGSLLRYYSATFLSFAGFMGPLFAAFYGWVFLNEHITWHFYVSTLIVFCGLYLFHQDELVYIKSPKTQVLLPK